MRRLQSAIAAFRRDTRGAVTILAAASMVLTMAGGALAVDMGSVYFESRRLQGVADAAALAAAGNIAAPATSAQAAITANNWARTITPDVKTGIWTGDATKTVAQRFVSPAASPNAARVQLSADTPLYFGRVFGIRSIHLVRSATATRIDLASFSLGSQLASLDGGIANSLLSQLTGSTISLSLADYNALLGADIDLLSYASALKTEIGITAGSFDKALGTSVTTVKALRALQNTLNAAGNTVAAAAIAKIAAGAPAGSLIPSALIELGQIGGQDRASSGTSINVNAYGALTNLLQLAGGARQVNLELGASIAGLTSVQATVVFGDRAQDSPWIAVTNTGNPILSTAQTRIYLQATALSSPALQALGIGPIRVPLYVDLAAAQAKLSSLSCSRTTRSVTLSVQPSIGHASIADVVPSSLTPMNAIPTESPGKIFTLLGINVTATARAELNNATWQSVIFSTADIDGRVTKTVTASGTVTGVTSSLLRTLGLNTAGIPINAFALSLLLKPVFDLVGPLLDGVLSGLLDTLGLHLGQADVRVNGVRCGAAALVA